MSDETQIAVVFIMTTVRGAANKERFNVQEENKNSFKEKLILLMHSVKLLLRFVQYVLSLEFLSHYKFTPFACFLVKYQSMSVICIGLFPRPVVCG